MTIYSEYNQKPDDITDSTGNNIGYRAGWNQNDRPVVWGCTLDTTDSSSPYVASVTKGDTTIANASASKTLSTPYRAGYTFKGWSTSSSGDSVAGDADFLQTASNGTYYTAWEATP